MKARAWGSTTTRSAGSGSTPPIGKASEPLNELTVSGPVQSSAYLRPVRSRNAELGAAVALAERLKARAALFQTDVADEIYFDPSSGYVPATGVSVQGGIRYRWGG